MHEKAGNQEDVPAVGILMLDTTFPRIPGDIGNPNTFSFPVIYKVVKGAFPDIVLTNPDSALLDAFLMAAQELVQKGVKAISTSCGLLAIFHRQLVAALDVPVYTSSLLQIHMLQSIVKENQTIGVITVSAPSLTARHFAGVGIEHCSPVIIGMEAAEEFSSVFIRGKSTIDVEKCRKEMETAALKLKRAHSNIGAIVLECTNMPPYSRAVQKAAGVPVFDVVTMLNYAYAALA
ncbi:MAG: aspartate/glutamate racemase family protein [Deltaproteobacteria bacterium]